MFEIQLVKPTLEVLINYDKLSIEYTGNSVLEMTDNGINGVRLKEVKTDEFTKNFDDDESPSALLNKYDLSNWNVVSVYDGEVLIAGAILAYRTKEINMLEDRDDLVVVWDIRIDEPYRRLGIGSMIFDYVKKWAVENNCARIKVESQNNNVRACKFYSAQGGTIGSFNRFAYKDYPNEIQIIWNIDVEGKI